MPLPGDASADITKNQSHSLRRESRGFAACGLRPLLTGDRRHGRGCELRRCSGRLTSGPGAPNGASRHRAFVENSAAELLFGRAARAGCHRSVNRPFRLHAAQASTSSARRYLNGRWDDHPTPPTHHLCAFVLRPSIYPHFPNPPRPGEPETRLSPLTHPIPSPVTQSRKSSSSHARATLTFTAPPSLSRLLFRQVFPAPVSRAPTHPRASEHGPLPSARHDVGCARVRAVRSTGLLSFFELSLIHI